MAAQDYRDLDWLVDPGPGTVGEKRNRLCAIAKGEFIAHFDDDDFSAPGRITDQLDRLTASGLAVTGYNMMAFTDGKRWWKNIDAPSRLAFGATLVYRRDWWQAHPFPALNQGEDTVFMDEAQKIGQLITADAGELMFGRNHSGNVSGRTCEGWNRIDPPRIAA
jgi:hypothetical protein